MPDTVAGEVIFQDVLDVPAVDSAIVTSAAALPQGWPAIAYVYLNPVAIARARRHPGAAPAR